MKNIFCYLKRKKNNIIYYEIDNHSKIKFNKKNKKWIKIIWKNGLIHKKCNILLKEIDFNLINKPDEKLGYFFLKSKKIKQHWTRIKLQNDNLLFEVDPKFDITPLFPWLTKKFTVNYNNFFSVINKIKNITNQNNISPQS